VKRQFRPVLPILTTKRLSLGWRELTFSPYAEAHCTQQNAQISCKTLQDHCTRQGFAGAFRATPSVIDEKREAQTAAGQNSARRRDRRGKGKGESSFRLIRRSLSNESPAPARFLPLLFVLGLSSWSSHRTTAAPLPGNRAQAPDCKDHAGSRALCRMSPQPKPK
jgi:hypothetical protein